MSLYGHFVHVCSDMWNRNCHCDGDVPSSCYGSALCRLQDAKSTRNRSVCHHGTTVMFITPVTRSSDNCCFTDFNLHSAAHNICTLARAQYTRSSIGAPDPSRDYHGSSLGLPASVPLPIRLKRANFMISTDQQLAHHAFLAMGWRS